jgi:glycosyltransferase involved in cell wall biosynthesis
MKILIAHSRYRRRGGEETVFEQETALLRNAGHEVIIYERSNLESAEFSIWQKAALPKNVIWNEQSRKELLRVLYAEHPDLVHFHNTHFMISPSAYYACREVNIPVVQSLHNPRLMCPAATFLRDGQYCQDCLGKTLPWPGILHRCYRESYVQTAMVAGMLAFHNWRQTWQRMIDRYIVFTEFHRAKFVEGGLPPEKLMVKPHFVMPAPQARQDQQHGEYAIFVGRLDHGKGIDNLVRAWQNLSIPLKICGTGTLVNHVRAATEASAWIQAVGPVKRDDIFALITRARFLVWPSEIYETFGMVAIEAFACGVPVIASRTGVAEEIVGDRVNGLLFEAGNAHDLAQKVTWAWDHPDAMIEMGRKARQTFEDKYSAERNYAMLLKIYEDVISQRNMTP